MGDEFIPEIETDIEETIETNEPTDTLSGEEELLAALKSLHDENDPEDEEDDSSLDSEEELDSEDEEEDEPEEEELDEEEDDEFDDEPVVEEPVKKVQTKEERARFAAERRERQLQERVKEELEKIQQENPANILANELSEMYGMPVEQIVEQMREAKLQKEAQEMKIPVEILKERQADREQLQKVQDELNQIRFEGWKSKIEADGKQLQTKFKMLSQEDIDEAVSYILHEAQNVDIPLEKAVYAVHGEKIINALANGKAQDKLAEESGRKKKTPLPIKGGKTSTKTTTVTDEERYIAKQMGMSVDDYLKYK